MGEREGKAPNIFNHVNIPSSHASDVMTSGFFRFQLKIKKIRLASRFCRFKSPERAPAPVYIG
jgi:hypothetical protein